MTRISRIDGKLAYEGVVLPPGPWHDEPDRLEFDHAGFTCLLLRNAAWCGYVAVPPGHPWHGKNYDDVRTVNADGDEDWPDVHGGLTYSGECSGHICHVPKPGEPDDVWWVGFDCNHHGDLSMSTLWMGVRYPDSSLWGGRGESYRDVEYVRWQTERLAAQAKAVQP